MRKWIIGLVVVFAIGCASFLTIVLQINPNDLKGVIASEVHAKTGRTLTIKGDMRWHFWPLTLSVDQLALSDDPQFQTRPMLKIGHMKVAVSPWGLLQKHLELGKVELSSVTVNWVRNKQKQNNFQMLIADMQRASGVGPKQMSASKWILSATGVEIEDGHIQYQDRASGTSLKVVPLNISIGAKQADQSRELSADFSLHSDHYTLANTLKGSIRLTHNWTHWSLNDFNWVIHPIRRKDHQKLTPIMMTGTANYQLREKTVNLRPFSIQHGQQSPMDGEVSIQRLKQTSQPLKVDFNLSTTHLIAFPLSQLLNVWPIHKHWLNNMSFNGQLKVDTLQVGNLKLGHMLTKITLNEDRLNVKQFTAEFYRGNLSASSQINLEQRHLHLKTDMAGVDSGALFATYCKKSPVKGSLRLNIDLNGELQANQTTHWQGAAQLNIKQGQLNGINVNQWQPSGDTAFRTLDARISLLPKKLAIHSLRLQLPHGQEYSGHGEGQGLRSSLHVTLNSSQQKKSKLLSIDALNCNPHYSLD